MTKFEEIEKVWDRFAIPSCDEVSDTKRSAKKNRLIELCRGDIQFSYVDDGRKDFAVVGGCIMLAEE